MEPRKILIVGDSLFAATLVQMLVGKEDRVITSTAPTAEAALDLLRDDFPDGLLFTAGGEEIPAIIGPFLTSHPNLPIIFARLDTGNLWILTSKSSRAGTSDLLNTIASLPKRSSQYD